MRFAVTVMAGFLLASPVAMATDSGPFSREDVFELEWVTDPQISPDGRRIAYARNFMDVMSDKRSSRIWLIDADGRNHVPLTGRDVGESGPAWSPDGKRLAFVSSTDEGAEIYVYWLESGKNTRITRLPKSPSGLSWSPDGRSIAFSMLVAEEPPVIAPPLPKPEGAEWPDAPMVTTRLYHEQDGAGRIEPGFSHFFVVDDIGGTARQVSSGDFHHGGKPQWTPDGRSLVFSANRNADWEMDYVNSEVYRLDLDSGDIVALTERDGPDEDPVVSPDGRKIAWASFEDKVQSFQVMRLHVMNADGSGKAELRPDLDRSVSNLHWDAAGQGVYYQYSDHGETYIAHTSLSGKSRRVASRLGGESVSRPYGGGSFSVSDNNLLAYNYSTPYRPAELAIADARRGEPRVITALNDDLLAHRVLGEVKDVRYKSSVDGRDLQGWTITPPGYDAAKRYPLIVENHGGPISHYGPHFSPELQLFAAAGYVVFYPNPRGSTSYGEEFANLLYHDYPGNDYQDVMDGVDALIRAGVTAEDRLYVTGGSAGGIMTAWIIGKNTRFRAAAVVKPVMNWVSKTLTADNYFMYANYRYPGQPWENIEEYMKYSPISLVGNIETPTMVMVGTADLRTPLSEAKQLYHALKIRGIDTALVEVPDAPHFIAGRPSQLITKTDHILAWFARYPVPQ